MVPLVNFSRKMWKSITNTKKEPAFYIKVEEIEGKCPSVNAKSSSYKISVTNFVKLWSCLLNNEDIIKIMVDSNTSIEADNKLFLKEKGLCLLNNPAALNETELNDGSLSLSLVQAKCIVFKMNFVLQKCCAEEFFDNVTHTLFRIIDDQKKSEQELRRQVDGIKGYLSKIPKEVLMRYEKHDIKDFEKMNIKSPSVMESIFGNNPEDGVDLNHIINRPLYKKPIIIKTEPDSTDPNLKITPSTSLPSIKQEPHSQPNESTDSINTVIKIKQIKEESQTATTINDSINIETNEVTKCESESPKKRLFEPKTEGNSSSPLSSQNNSTLTRHGVLLTKKKQRLNY